MFSVKFLLWVTVFLLPAWSLPQRLFYDFPRSNANNKNIPTHIYNEPHNIGRGFDLSILTKHLLQLPKQISVPLFKNTFKPVFKSNEIKPGRFRELPSNSQNHNESHYNSEEMFRTLEYIFYSGNTNVNDNNPMQDTTMKGEAEDTTELTTETTIDYETTTDNDGDLLDRAGLPSGVVASLLG